jgi:hypothetical protein
MKIAGKDIEVKDLTGACGAIGELSALLIKQSGLAVGIGVLSSLFVIIWGWLERKNQYTLVKALAILFLFIGPLTLVGFVSIGWLLFLSEVPSTVGRKLFRDSSNFELGDNQPTQYLTGQHNLKFSRESDWVEVSFMPSTTNDIGIKEINVTNIKVPQGQAHRVHELQAKNTSTEVFFGIEKPSPSFNIF